MNDTLFNLRSPLDFLRFPMSLLDKLRFARLMARTHFKVHMGGLQAAVDFYATAPTPNLIVVESALSGEGLTQSLALLADS